MLAPPPPPIKVFDPHLLDGQTALVTGGGTGLGRVIAQSLAEVGADLVLAARNVARLEQAAEEIRAATGRRVAVHAVNIRDRARRYTRNDDGTITYLSCQLQRARAAATQVDLGCWRTKR